MGPPSFFACILLRPEHGSSFLSMLTANASAQDPRVLENIGKVSMRRVIRPILSKKNEGCCFPTNQRPQTDKTTFRKWPVFTVGFSCFSVGAPNGSKVNSHRARIRASDFSKTEAGRPHFCRLFLSLKPRPHSPSAEIRVRDGDVHGTIPEPDTAQEALSRSP